MRGTFSGAVAAVALLAIGACKTDGTTGPGSGTPVTINWSPCINDAGAPAWFAFQDGSGAWTKVASTNGVFTFTVNSGKVGVATYANGQLTVVYATSAEMNGYKPLRVPAVPSDEEPSCSGSRRTVSGTVTGYSDLDNIDIEMEQGSASIYGAAPATSASFQLTNVAPGAVDVLAVRWRRSTTASTVQVTPSAVFIRRGQSTSPLAAIDLNSTVESGAPVSKTVTVSGAASNELLIVLSILKTSTSTIDMSVSWTDLTTVTGNVAALFYGVSSSRLSTGEKQQLVVASFGSSGARLVATTFTDAADQTVALGSTLGTVTVAGASARPSASYVFQTGYDKIFELDLDQYSGSEWKSNQITMTRAYVGATATAVRLLVPDLTGVSGFQPTWLMTGGTTATWSFFAGNATLGSVNGGAQAFIAATRSATFIP